MFWRVTGTALARTAEATLAITGLLYTLLGGDDNVQEAFFLFGWDTLALTYLVTGIVVVRRGLRHPPPDDTTRTATGRRLPPWLSPRRGRRFSFLLTVSASLTGLSAALDVLTDADGGDLRSLVNGLAVVAVGCAFLLLHVGYAHFYRAWNVGTTGMLFPRTDRPATIDYLYFAMTVGVSFAASDVSITSRNLRWHVMVHSVVAFFYNTVVLAIAIGFVTRR